MGLQEKLAGQQCQSQPSDIERQLSAKVSRVVGEEVAGFGCSPQESETAVLQGRLQSLQQSHSTLLASSEQLSATHRKAEAQLAEQLRMRQEELSRTRAQVSCNSHLLTHAISLSEQVSSLSIELTAEKKLSEELRAQLSHARAETTRHQTQVHIIYPYTQFD